MSRKREKNDKTYIIESITYFVGVENELVADGGNAPVVNRIARERVSYLIRALKPILKNHSVFTERYRTYHGDTLIGPIGYWHGSEKEDIISEGSSLEYEVSFDLPVGEQRTIITGANYRYDLSKYSIRSPHPYFGLLAANEAVATYPNRQGGDYINELVIIVESNSIALSVKDNSVMHYSINREVTTADNVQLVINNVGGTKNTTVTARWRNVLPGEAVGLRYSW
jgi:hypothetical protein